MERKLNIAVLVSRPSAVETVDVVWDEPVQLPLGQRSGQAAKHRDRLPPAAAGEAHGDSAAD